MWLRLRRRVTILVSGMLSKIPALGSLSNIGVQESINSKGQTFP